VSVSKLVNASSRPTFLPPVVDDPFTEDETGSSIYTFIAFFSIILLFNLYEE